MLSAELLTEDKPFNALCQAGAVGMLCWGCRRHCGHGWWMKQPSSPSLELEYLEFPAPGGTSQTEKFTHTMGRTAAWGWEQGELTKSSQKWRKQFSCVMAGSQHSHKPQNAASAFWVGCQTPTQPFSHFPCSTGQGRKGKKSWGSIYGQRNDLKIVGNRWVWSVPAAPSPSAWPGWHRVLSLSPAAPPPPAPPGPGCSQGWFPQVFPHPRSFCLLGNLLSCGCAGSTGSSLEQLQAPPQSPQPLEQELAETSPRCEQ